jgi:2,4-dienoyl-CoA reductase-like NADH-dependent reductase (Old Yellow Enzyme family)
MFVQPLFTAVRMGALRLPNRIVMAPLTRMRAGPIDHVPTALQAEYYSQRASAGLIVAEATAIGPDGFGWADTPGLWRHRDRRFRHFKSASRVSPNVAAKYVRHQHDRDRSPYP